MNNIPDLQSSDHALCILYARERTYGLATTLQVAQLVIAIAIPTTLAFIAVQAPEARAALATASLGCLLLDITVLDRALGFFLRRAAKIGEQFDCEVLQLPWNAFIADKKIDHEDIVAAAEAFSKNEKKRSKLRDWYPVVVKRAPLHVARIACQLANIRYDVKLRRRYGTLLLVLPIVVLIVVVAASLTLSFPDAVLSVVVPAMPATVWTLRELFRHNDAAAAQDRTKAAVEAVWVGIKERSEAECTLKAREIQDALYLRRVSSPLIFPLVYHLLRDKMEEQMRRGADERLIEAEYPSEADVG